jgi:hypothetical protein
MTTPPTQDFTYDVFISYRRKAQDGKWVHKVLVPRLKAEGLRICIDDECFRLGGALIKEIERAVEQSRYTLAILSPAYLESDFADLENLFAEHLGLERMERRLLAVLREPCRPRLGVRARLWLDMTADATFESDLTRLVDELRRLPEP